MSRRKYLLASGCSYTNPNYVSGPHPEMDCSWPKWPEIVADKLGLEAINLGRNGMGYKYIVDSLMPHIVSHPEDIEVVMVGWSETWRELYFHGAGVNMLADFTAIGRLLGGKFEDGVEKPHAFQWRKANEWEDAHQPLNKIFLDCGWKNKTLSKEFMLHLYGDVFKNIVILQRICKLYNIPVIQGNLLNMDIGAMYRMMIEDEIKDADARNPYLLQIHQTSMDAFLNNEYFNDVDPKGWIGFPIFKDAGGFTIYDEIETRSWAEGREKYKISSIDTHPNAYGQECIAKYYLEEYESIR